MGNCSSSETRVIEIKPQQTEEPETLRVKLNGAAENITADSLRKKVCDELQEFANRFEVQATSRKENYLITIKALPGDDSGVVATTSRRLKGLINKGDLALTDDCKIVSFKLYETMSDD
ncbi:uncharacterized protein [Diadema setosum]|uniref:uncharacterized protein n=1 Tax=Diadema setosum TaxID=31175 RepID=UPI003B3BCE91